MLETYQLTLAKFFDSNDNFIGTLNFEVEKEKLRQVVEHLFPHYQSFENFLDLYTPHEAQEIYDFISESKTYFLKS